ncbi:unnamed protein product [Didymodactylos carnosus]|uniref:Elongin-A n=1 Tax=Didymodactylos carnosus TaxID=1234261 RepID=A0A8S2UKG8_9BILA|nr:unnamed protein product [Didymodactylos carnosus]CAF4342767.1 unnamed protein product [Didymodactylos carnosus]
MNEYFSKRSSNVLIASLDSDSQNNEKLTTELMNGNQSNNTNLTETEIEELRDSFNKTTNLLAANAPKLDNIRDDNNNEKKQSLSSIKGFTKSNLESQQNGNSDKKLKGLWEEASDDDEEETVVKQKQTTVSKINNDGNDPVQRKKKQSLPTSSVSSKTKTTIQPKKGSIVTKTKLSPKKSIQSSTKNVPEKSQEQTKSLSTSDKQSEHLKHQQTISTTVRTSLPPPPRPSQLTASSSQSTLKKSSVIDNTSLQCLSSRRERTQMYSGKKTIRDHIPKLESLCLDTLKEHIDVISSRHFNLLPYELLQPIIELATPEQLKNIVYNNQNYADDIEPLWKRFCQIDFKSSEPDENESYFELYWV